jgi:hypothetical protein
MCFSLFSFFFKIWLYWGLNSEVMIARQLLYHLSHACKFLKNFSYFSDRVSHFCPGLALDHDPPTYLSYLGLQSHTTMSSFWLATNFLPRLALNLNPPHFCLLRNRDYRHEPLHLALLVCFLLQTTISHTLQNIKRRSLFGLMVPLQHHVIKLMIQKL